MSVPAIHAKRANFFYRDQRSSWTETYWKDPSVPLRDALNSAINLGRKRAQFLGRDVEWFLTRVSDDAVFRDSFIDTSFASWQNGNQSAHIYNNALAVGLGTAPPTVILRVRQEATANYRRIMYLGGVPKEVVIDQGNLVDGGSGLQSSFAAAYGAWARYLVNPNNGWGFVSFDRSLAVQANIILSITQATVGAPILVQVAGDTAWIQVNKTVQIRLAKANPCSCKINGKYVVLGVSGNTISLSPPPNCCATISWKSGGVLSDVVRIWNLITDAVPVGWASHKRGGSAGLPRGKSRPRRVTVC